MTEVRNDEELALLYPNNVTADEDNAFTPTMLQAYRAFENAGNAPMQAIAIFPDLKKITSTNIFSMATRYSAFYYPPITQEPASAIRSEQHEDINLITLLVGQRRRCGPPDPYHAK